MYNERCTMYNEKVLCHKSSLIMESSLDDETNDFWVFEPAGEYVAEPNVVLEKAFAFAVSIVNLHKWLYKTHPNIGALATQILKSGTSIGANTNEDDGAFSKREFASKLGISLKEARETNYWLRLLYQTDYIGEAMFTSLSNDCGELIRLLIAIIRSTRAALENESKKRFS